MPILIDVTSDFICLQCQIAENRLFQAIDGPPREIEVAVRRLPFELMPAEGMDRKICRSLKFRSGRRTQELAAGIARPTTRNCTTS